MNRDQYLGLNVIAEFTSWLADRLPLIEGHYVANNRRIPRAQRRFDAVGVAQALENYAWPSRFIAPAAVEGFDFQQGQVVDALNWVDTQTRLSYFRVGLNAALHQHDRDATLLWAGAILHWGMGTRGAATLNYLAGMPDPAGYLSYRRAALALERIDEAKGRLMPLIPYMSSGLGKVHSLAAPDGLIIYDSRVALALTREIHLFLQQRGEAVIPEPLKLRVARGRVPPSVGDDKHNHPQFVRDWTWMQAQIRASWILQAALEENPLIFQVYPMPDRMHKAEAALFMLGAQ
jgi:hypothetical protein